jgi:hypothetical protein
MASKLGHEQPDLDSRAAPEGSLLSHASEPAEPASDTSLAAERESIKPVSEIMEVYQQRLAERAVRWQELTDSNWLPGRVKAQLDKEFPDLKSSEQIEQEELARNAALRQQTRLENGGSEQKAKTRSGLGPNQLLNADEPPPNVPDSRKTY